jgi:hypothetical protein
MDASQRQIKFLLLPLARVQSISIIFYGGGMATQVKVTVVLTEH